MGDDTSDDVSDTGLLDEARLEMDRASDDLERVVRLLDERTARVEWLEALVDELLGLVGVPVLVLDADGCITAVSRGAEDDLPGARDALGKPGRSVLPEPLGDDVTKVSLPGAATLVVLPR
jgi:PAS domain-containing protein